MTLDSAVIMSYGHTKSNDVAGLLAPGPGAGKGDRSTWGTTEVVRFGSLFHRPVETHSNCVRPGGGLS